MRRSLVSIFALGLVSLVGLVHCTSVTNRSGFAAPDGGTAAPAGDDDDIVGPGFDPDGGGAGDADDTVCTQDIDIVLVLDISSSMTFVLDRLGSDIEGVVTSANALKPGAHFGFVGYADNAAFALGGSAGEGRIHTTATSLKDAFKEFKATYTAENRNPGDGPTGRKTQNPICEENALDALHMAATEFPWRDGAARIIVVATDETFLAGGENYGDRDDDGDTTSTDFPTEGDYPAVHGYADTIKAVKDAKARVFSFTKLKGPVSCGGFGGTPRRFADRDAITWGWTNPYDGEDPIPTQTDGKNFDLDGVRTNKVDLKDTINEVVLKTHCAGDPPK